MIPDPEIPTDAAKTDMPRSATERAAEGGQADPATHVAETTPDPSPALADAADRPPAADPDDAPPPADDPPQDDRVTKGKGDKARAATLGQVAPPKPKPAKDEPEIYAEKRAAFEKHTPFGILLPYDLKCLLRATARDTGRTVARVQRELGL